MSVGRVDVDHRALDRPSDDRFDCRVITHRGIVNEKALYSGEVRNVSRIRWDGSAPVARVEYDDLDFDPISCFRCRVLQKDSLPCSVLQASLG